MNFFNTTKFFSQKPAIKKKIVSIKKVYIEYTIIYYSKFYYKLNYIEHFCYDKKNLP